MRRHTLLVWLLWKAVSMAPEHPHWGETLVRAFDSKKACVQAARTRPRNAILYREKGEDRVGIEVFVCLQGEDPALATFR